MGNIPLYVAHRHEVLRYGDLFLAKIDVRNLPTMRNETKKYWIKNLDTVRESCESELGKKEERTEIDY